MQHWKKILTKLLKAHNIFAVFALGIGIGFAVIVPPLWGFDETSHFARVYQLSQGQIIQDKSSDNYGGIMPKNFNDISRYVSADIGEQKDPNLFTRKDLNDNKEYKQLLDNKFSDDTEQAINPAGYSFLTYPFSVLFVTLSNLFDLDIRSTLFIARMGGLLFYVTIVYYAIRALQAYKIKWLFVAVGLSPVIIVQAATLSADTVVNGMSLLFMSLLIRAFLQNKIINPIHKYMLFALAICIPLIKFNYIFLTFSLALLPAKVFISKRKELLFKGGALATSVILGVISTLMMSVTSTSGVSPRSDGIPIDPSGQIAFILSSPFEFVSSVIRSFISNGDTYIHEAFGILGWNYVVLPLAFVLITIFTILIAGLYAKDELSKFKKESYIITAGCMVGVVTIFAALYVGFTPVGKYIVDGVQGRYLLPFLIPIVVCIVNILPLKIISPKTSSITSIVSATSVILLTLSLLYYIVATY